MYIYLTNHCGNLLIIFRIFLDFSWFSKREKKHWWIYCGSPHLIPSPKEATCHIWTWPKTPDTSGCLGPPEGENPLLHWWKSTCTFVIQFVSFTSTFRLVGCKLLVLPGVEPRNQIVKHHGRIPIHPSVDLWLLHLSLSIDNVLDTGHCRRGECCWLLIRKVGVLRPMMSSRIAAGSYTRGREFITWPFTASFPLVGLLQHPKPDTSVSNDDSSARRNPTSPCLMIMKITNSLTISRHTHDTWRLIYVITPMFLGSRRGHATYRIAPDCGYNPPKATLYPKPS